MTNRINQRKYLRDPNKCPFCDSTDVLKAEIWPDNDEIGEWANRDAKCLSCGQEWRDIYKLEEVQDISNIKDTKFREAYVKDYWKANTKIRKGGRLCHHGQSVE